MLNLDPLRNLADSWEEEAQSFRQRGLEREARMAESFAKEFRARLREWETESLTVADASDESEYSERRLRELLSKGKVPNAGKAGAPRIRRRDLPAKPGSEGSTLEVADDSASLAAEALSQRTS